MAAGSGTRLDHLTKEAPKALIRVGERTLVDYAIAFLNAVGIEDIVVVGGVHFEQIRECVESLGKGIRIVENKEYKKESLSSLQTALPHVSGSFLQIDVDFIYTWDIAEKVKAQLKGKGIKAICTSDKRAIPEDMVKVSVDGDLKVTDMEKDLPEFSYGYIGMFYCEKKSLPLLREQTEKILEDAGESGAKMWKALTTVAERTGEVHVGDIGDFDAVEVDTPKERQEAEKFIKRNQKSVNRYFVV